MSVSFTNPPLVELIAELRWGPQEIKSGQKFGIDLPLLGDDVILHFAAQIAAKGYARLERLLPAGIPPPPLVPVCRFRPTSVDQPSPLFQIGSGLFTVNALPPNYTKWDDFVPKIREGIDTLLDAHKKSGVPLPQGNRVVVRYRDVFKSDLTGGVEPLKFIGEVLGFKIELPVAITSLAAESALIQPSLQVKVPLEIGSMTLSIGQAQRNGEVAVMLDTAVTVQRALASDVDTIIQAMTEARNVIHDVFLKLTERIHSAMGPK